MAILTQVVAALLYGLALASGLVWVGLWYVLKQALLDPAMEWLLEFYEQHFVSAAPDEGRQSEMIGKREVVVISDLHVDTWERAPGGQETRERSFLEFLKAIEPTTRELYINGDLLDAPPNPEDTWKGKEEDFTLKGSILPKYERVIEAISILNNRTAERPVPVFVTFLYGNHDMALSGLRYDLVRRELLKRFRVPFNKSWYPNVVIGVPPPPRQLEGKGRERYRFYVDHGHFYDPVLLLYLRDFLFAALRSDLKEAMTSIVLAGQRRTKETQAPVRGLAPAKAETRDQRLACWLVKYRWRWKARAALAERNADESNAGRNPIGGALFGHTHLPDDGYTFRLWGARGMKYVNTGDWMGETGHGTYTVIAQDGVVMQYDWLDAKRRAPHHQRQVTS